MAKKKSSISLDDIVSKLKDPSQTVGIVFMDATDPDDFRTAICGTRTFSAKELIYGLEQVKYKTIAKCNTSTTTKS